MNFAARLYRLTFFFCLVLSPIVASSQEVDVTGNWNVILFRSGQPSPFRTEAWQLIYSSPGGVDGTFLASTNVFGTISGGYDGSLFLAEQPQNANYQVFLTSTVTTTTTMMGTWFQRVGSDTVASGNWNGAKVIPPTPTPVPTATPTRSPTPTPAPIVLKSSAISLSCQRGPSAKDDVVCNATVSSPEGLQRAPTGQVQFFAFDGSFRLGDRCTLSAPSTATDRATCGVVYTQTAGDARTKASLDLLVVYVGDGFYGPSSNNQNSQTVVTETKLPKKTQVCFSTQEQPCPGVNAVLPTTLGKNGLGKIVLKYFGPTGLPSGVPARLAASSGTSGFTPPKNASDVKMRMTYSLKPSENPWYRVAVPLGIQRTQPRSGVTFGTVNTTVKFGQSKTVNLPLKSVAKKVVSSAVTAQVQQVKVRVRLITFRKGDKKPSVFTRPYFMNMQFN